MARKKRRKTKQFTINEYNLGAFLIAISFLYFFAFFLAPDSPILKFFNNIVSFAFGQVGTIPFFAILFILGTLFIIKGYLIKTLTKQFFLLLVFLSAIFNFSIIDTNQFYTATGNLYKQNGGYLSWPVLKILTDMFGNNALAIKSLIVILFVLIVIYIFYTLNVKLPKLPKIQVVSKPSYNKIKKEIKKNHGQNTLFNIKNQKNKQTKNIGSGIFGFKKQSNKQEQIPNNNFSNKTIQNTISTKSKSENNILKNILKDKIKKEVENKINEKTLKQIKFPEDKPTFSTQELQTSQGENIAISEEFLLQKAQAIQSKLMEFNVPIKIDGFDIGPSVIQIKIKPEAGIKVSTIEGLKNDIALALKSRSLRIIAPIAGTDCVGIQIPNPNPAIVHLGDILDSLEFRKSIQKYNTNLALGKGIDGKNIIKPLEKMPHLLIAGATGSGKSVGVNDFIISLMYQNTPAELKFLMIDPKQVELEFYSGLPYLLAPIVTQPDKALKLLQRAVEEMETRYSKLKSNRVKNLDEYNEKFPDNKMYRIVFVIDELADLMMTGNKKEVENCITRIAQKARAVGMHLIVATQRPSVNVLTGLIKANMPTRIAFGVVSQVDSRTILGIKGAEDLLGKGDLLYMDPNTKFPIRIQAPFISTQETELIISKLKQKYMNGLTQEDIYHPEIINMLKGKVEIATSSKSHHGGHGDEELIEKAIEIIAETHKASATMLQRKLNIGFARAARIMDELEARGIVGPQEGAKPRQVYI